MLVTCAHFYDPMEAHLVRARLESEGIPASVTDDHLLTANWQLTVALGGVRVQVPEEFLAQAQEILSHYWAGAFAADVEAETDTLPATCPSCQGTSVDQEVPTAEKLLAVGFFVVSGATFPTRTSQLRCKSCGNRWAGVA